MTQINRRLRRETPATVWSQGSFRAIVIDLLPRDPSMCLQLKGCRRAYRLPFKKAYEIAVELERQADQQQRSLLQRVNRCLTAKRYP